MTCDAAEWGATPTYEYSKYGPPRCRCIICPRCGHHTGNGTQGHYWKSCRVLGELRAAVMADQPPGNLSGEMKARLRDDWHFCCPDPAFGCELEQRSRA